MPIPLEIRLSRERNALVVCWQDGATDHLPATMLRRAARDAGAVRAALDDAAPALAEGLTILDVRPVGSYAVNLFFSDGHDRGIYPWALLHALGREGEKNPAAGN